MHSEESSIPPNAPDWLRHLLQRFDALTQTVQEGMAMMNSIGHRVFDRVQELEHSINPRLDILERRVARLEVRLEDDEVKFGQSP